MVLEEFILDKFVNPLCHYYTLEATLAYGILLAIAVFGVYKILQRLKIKIDKHFLIALVPFIIYGGWTRALRDHGLYQGWWWCSPPIYFVVFGVTFLTLLAAIFLERKYKFVSYWKATFSVGVALLLYNITLTNITNWFAVEIILGLIGIWALIFFGLHYRFPKIVSLENATIMVAHLLDASATFTALSFFGYYEQHVLPRFLIGIFGPWIMFPLKIVVVGAVLYFLDREEDVFLRNFLKIIVLILGLALGIRDLLTVSMI